RRHGLPGRLQERRVLRRDLEPGRALALRERSDARGQLRDPRGLAERAALTARLTVARGMLLDRARDPGGISPSARRRTPARAGALLRTPQQRARYQRPLIKMPIVECARAAL